MSKSPFKKKIGPDYYWSRMWKTSSMTRAEAAAEWMRGMSSLSRLFMYRPGRGAPSEPASYETWQKVHKCLEGRKLLGPLKLLDPQFSL